jgi:UDP-glucose 4-epimerase
MGVCLVIGGAGFLGSHLVEALVADGQVVRVLDNLTTGTTEHLARVMDVIELYPGDFTNVAFLERVVRGAELVFHLGGDGEPTTEGISTLHVLSTALAARVRRVLFASSTNAGEPRPHPTDDTPGLAPSLSPLGWARLSGEQACATFSRSSALETVCLRYFNVFGPRQHKTSAYAAVVREALDTMLVGRSPVFEGDERSAQDLLYVDDAVHAALLAARAPRVGGKVYHVARGKTTTGGEIVAVLNDLLGTQIKPVYTGGRSDGTPCTQANVRRTEVELGFCPATDLRRGLSRCLHARSWLWDSDTGSHRRPESPRNAFPPPQPGAAVSVVRPQVHSRGNRSRDRK